MSTSRKMIVGAVLLLAATCATDLTGAQSGNADASDPEAAPLYMLTYDHGGLVLWGKEHFVNYLQNAIAWLDHYPGFKIGLDNEAYTYDQLAAESPEVLEQIREYLRQYAGRFGIGTCTYGQPLSVFINEESNIRQIGYALKADRTHFNCAPDIYLMSEHAMHTQIPQILKGFGFKGAIMRTHYMMYGYNPTFDAPIGWWVGLDGSRIAAIPTYMKEGAEFGKTTVDNWILTRYPSPNASMSPADFRKAFSYIHPLLASRADDASLRREELVREYEGKPGYTWILMDDLLSRFPAPETLLQTAPNDFVVRMPWGYCGNEIWNQSRTAEVAVLTAERLASLAMLYGDESRQSRLDKAWKDLLVAQHHDIQICGLLAEARRHLPASIALSKGIQIEALQYIASHMKGGPIAQIVAFNPLSWPRADWITVALSLPRGAATDVVVSHDGKVVPSAIRLADRYSDGSLRDIRLSLYADLAALAVNSYGLAPKNNASNPKTPGQVTVDGDALTLSSPYWEVRFDRDGGIVSLLDRAGGRQLLKPGQRSAFFAGVINGDNVASRGRWNLRAPQEDTPWATACETGFIGSIPYQFEMRFRADTPCIPCRVRFTFDGQKIGRLSDNMRDASSPFLHEEKLRFKMFPAVSETHVGVRDLPFAVSETHDPYINGLYWAALTDGDNGMAFFNRGTMGSVREKDGGFSMPLAYAMYYIWGTRMLAGDFTYEFAVLPFTGPWQDADLHRRALEYNYPVACLTAAPREGSLASVLQPLAVQSSDVIVSALYNDRGSTCIRMYEHRGKRSSASLDYTIGDAHFSEVNLAGEKTGDPARPLEWQPWQIRTFRLDPKE